MEIKLLQKYIAGDAEEYEAQQVIAWINESDDNRREYMAQRKLYDIALWRTDAATDEDELSSARRWTVKMVLKETLKIAAVAAVAFTAAYFWMNRQTTSPSESLQAIYAPAGQRSEIQLSDGTRVWLNSCSRLTYSDRFVGNQRRVKLEGEAYFIVTKNKEKPFIVETNQYNIKVLGTEFNVSAYPNDKEWKTSLLNGKVEILDEEGMSKMTLEPNTLARVEEGRLVKSLIKDDNDFMWRKGLLCFTNLSIHEMIHKLELYYDVHLVVRNTRMMNKYYTGKFRIGDGIEHVLNVLKLDNKFTYTYDEDNKLIIIK